MRINKYVALATGMSRRDADEAIAQARVVVNDQSVALGAAVNDDDRVTLDGKLLHLPEMTQTIMLNKPAGYVCSRDGQGSQTIYDLLPPDLHHLKPVGRLDKDSSGLLILTNDGNLANQLTHPSFEKKKVYTVTLNKSLDKQGQQNISAGIELQHGLSNLLIRPLDERHKSWQITLQEGRNRQIRRTFAAIGYEVKTLHRTAFGPYQLASLASGTYAVPESL